jgi:prepilin-type N-terminal cleavage/methylation domain-containing protein
MSRSRAFTLIELWVVIALLALLAAILFPVLASVREQGRRAACTGSHRQLGAALLLYAQDHDETFPPALYEVARHEQYPAWPILTEPYSRGNRRLTLCPSLGTGASSWAYADQSPGNAPSYLAPPPAAPRWARFSQIGLNWIYLSPVRYDPESAAHHAPPDNTPFPTRLPEVTTPAQTVMLTDSAYWAESGVPWGTHHGHVGYLVVDPPRAANAKTVYWFGGWKGAFGGPEGPYGRVAVRHGEGTLVTWVDGHTSWVSIERLRDDALWDLR